ncbi:MAG TPA: hypothetical protein VH855_16170 [Acetobacteraceae bacterium]|jgi:hypothetical protein
MFPLVAIGGAIGAVMSIAKGASWLTDQISDKGAASAGGKAGPKALTEAQASAFAATLAAQTAGQTMPASPASPASAAAVTQQVTGPDENTAARAKAGVLAYSHIGAHHGHRAGAIKQPANEGSAAATA